MIKTLIISTALIAGTGAAQADVVGVAYDEPEKAFVVLSDAPCVGVHDTGKVAGVRTEAGREFIGCWHGDGADIIINFPLYNLTMVYKAHKFKILDKHWNVTDGIIWGTV